MLPPSLPPCLLDHPLFSLFLQSNLAFPSPETPATLCWVQDFKRSPLSDTDTVPPPLCNMLTLHPSAVFFFTSLSLSLSGLYSLPLLFCLLPLFSLCPSSSLSPFLILFIFADLTKDKVTGEFSILCICSPKGLSRSLAVCLHHSPQHRVFTCVFTH